MTLADLMHGKAGNVEPERTCRLCGNPFVPEDEEQLYCGEMCEHLDRKIDEAEARREEREDG